MPPTAQKKPVQPIFHVVKPDQESSSGNGVQPIKLRKRKAKTISKKNKLLGGDDENLEDPNYVYKCRYCDRAFKKSVSLGGHISKAHNGKSDLYKRKMEIRASR